VITVDGPLDSFQIALGLFLDRLSQMCDTADFESRHSLGECKRRATRPRGSRSRHYPNCQRLCIFHSLLTDPATAGSASNPVVPEKSIAVLPFEKRSRDHDNAYLAKGIQEHHRNRTVLPAKAVQSHRNVIRKKTEHR
jgi:hypothetical protein